MHSLHSAGTATSAITTLNPNTHLTLTSLHRAIPTLCLARRRAEWRSYLNMPSISRLLVWWQRRMQNIDTKPAGGLLISIGHSLGTTGEGCTLGERRRSERKIQLSNTPSSCSLFPCSVTTSFCTSCYQFHCAKEMQTIKGSIACLIPHFRRIRIAQLNVRTVL
jgi:hypothetical protein